VPLLAGTPARDTCSTSCQEVIFPPVVSQPPILTLQPIACWEIGLVAGILRADHALKTCHSSSLRIWLQGVSGFSRPAIVIQ
jgi:hypothetical protein